MVIYSRFDLNRMLLERAERAGAQIEKARVLKMTRQGAAGSLHTSGGAAQRRFLHRGDGRPATRCARWHRIEAAGHHDRAGILRPGDQERIDLQFLPGLKVTSGSFRAAVTFRWEICGKGEQRRRDNTRSPAHGPPSGSTLALKIREQRGGHLPRAGSERRHLQGGASGEWSQLSAN